MLRTSSKPSFNKLPSMIESNCATVLGEDKTTYAAGTNKTYTHLEQKSEATREKRIVICYNCKKGGYIASSVLAQAEKVNMVLNDKVLLVQAQASGQALTEEEIAFLEDQDFLTFKLSAVFIKCAFKPMIWMPMTLIVMNSTQPRLLLWRICPGMGSDALIEVLNTD
ncbi:hypothetical protein Tco_1049519 [Tanacetum coccineum]